jgi:hypothetical protein
VPLTPDSFRGSDPRAQVFVRALTGFYVGRDRDPIEAGAVVQVPWSVATMLIHSNKAERCEGPARPAPRSTPEPEAKASQSEAKASKEKVSRE